MENFPFVLIIYIFKLILLSQCHRKYVVRIDERNRNLEDYFMKFNNRHRFIPTPTTTTTTRRPIFANHFYDAPVIRFKNFRQYPQFGRRQFKNYQDNSMNRLKQFPSPMTTTSTTPTTTGYSKKIKLQRHFLRYLRRNPNKKIRLIRKNINGNKFNLQIVPIPNSRRHRHRRMQKRTNDHQYFHQPRKSSRRISKSNKQKTEISLSNNFSRLHRTRTLKYLLRCWHSKSTSSIYKRKFCPLLCTSSDQHRCYNKGICLKYSKKRYSHLSWDHSKRYKEEFVCRCEKHFFGNQCQYHSF
ncbi:hypothetical protein SNEBB_005513 [Seison nebaliae]|nr:hypothetical protein SNEBB_005513 [Seison nebaliae]